MTLNKQKGNMYAFVTHTWNPIKGKCSHNCKYCYMKIYKQKPLRLVEKELEDDLGSNRFIFVGSSTDMFAANVPKNWIKKVLYHCRQYKNIYLFQTKNPKRFNEFKDEFPLVSIFGTTLESNKEYNIDNAPNTISRAIYLTDFKRYELKVYNSKCKSRAAICFKKLEVNNIKMVSIEPIMDFDLKPFVKMIKNIEPEWVVIGADSKNHNLIEPSKEKILNLIKELEKFTNVNIKDNLKRLMK